MNEQQRDFKGVWITKEIWLDKRLNSLEKVILAEIDSLDGENGCFASNQYIAEFCQCSLTKVSTAISKLINHGYIYTASFDGRTRILKSRLSKNERQDFKKCEAEIQDLKDNNIGYQEKGLYSNPQTPNVGETETGLIFVPHFRTPQEAARYAAKNAVHALFEQFWDKYPRKVDKKGTERIFCRIKGIADLMPTILTALENQKKSDQWQRDGGRYIPNPKTWINQERWNDQTDAPSKSNDFQTFDPEEAFQNAVRRRYEQ